MTAKEKLIIRLNDAVSKEQWSRVICLATALNELSKPHPYETDENIGSTSCDPHNFDPYGIGEERKRHP